MTVYTTKRERFFNYKGFVFHVTTRIIQGFGESIFVFYTHLGLKTLNINNAQIVFVFLLTSEKDGAFRFEDETKHHLTFSDILSQPPKRQM